MNLGVVVVEIGLVPQEMPLEPFETPMNTCRLSRGLFGRPRNDALIEGVLRDLSLWEKRNDKNMALSGGMRRRVLIAKALSHEPEILFLDEPTDGLDPVSSNAIRALITEQAERGVAVILTTHDMLEADKLSDRVAFINEGAIVALDTPEALKMKYGSRTVRLRFTEGDGVREEVVSLEEGNAGDALKAAVSNGDLATIHTEEATLEQIFIEITGRGLES